MTTEFDEDEIGDVPVYVEDPFAADDQETNENIQTGDDALVRHGNRWFFSFVGAALLAVSGWGAWIVDPRTEAVPYVEVLMVEELSGQVTRLQGPVPMKDFIAPASMVHDLLVRFVDDWRRRGKDDVQQESQQQFFLARLCGAAPEQIKTLEAKDAAIPRDDRPALVALEIPAPMPTESPRTWRVQWKEYWSNAQGKPLGQHIYLSDITLSHYEPKDLGVLVRNRLGLCVSGVTRREVW